MTTDPDDTNAGQAQPAGLAVFFDGGCPLCRREIDFYRRRAGAEAISWVDISAVESDSVAPGLTREAALARFHVRRGDGSLVSGATAFAELWRALPAFRTIGRIAAIPPLPTLLEWAYRVFLPIRPTLQRLTGGGRRDAACAPCAEIGVGKIGLEERGKTPPLRRDSQ
jgi:predicted DCC family thiol-disulfide oxidoreductase YuxK